MSHFEKHPQFAAIQYQVITQSQEFTSNLTEQEKEPGRPERLHAVLRLLDIRAGGYLKLVDDLEAQKVYMILLSTFADDAWQAFTGYPTWLNPATTEDANANEIKKHVAVWIAEGYRRLSKNDELVVSQETSSADYPNGMPTVFISYSWDDESHKEWVLNFANRLRDDGIDAIIDQTHLDLGGDTPEFMERSIRDSQFVLVVCTKNYRERFDGRRGGAGYEGHIMTAQMIKRAGANKFIPLLRRGTWDTAMPTALEGLFGADLSKDSEAEYRKLVKHLHGVKSIRPLGTRPKWLDEQTTPSSSAEQNRGVGFLPSDDLTLMHHKQDSSLNIWLINHTLAPMDACRFILNNLQKFSERHQEFQKNPFTPMEMIGAQTILADGTTNEAIPLASFQNTNKKTLLIFRTFPFESACILSAEILIEGGGRRRTETRFIRWKPGQDPEFIDDPRLVKPREPTNPRFLVPAEYAEERKGLPESPLIRKIWGMPNWSICCRPEEFKGARFRDLDHCTQFVVSAQVYSRARWDKYPWYSTSLEYGDKWIASECELIDTSEKHLEHWVLFRSGQFVHSLALDQMAALSGRTHVLEIINTTTAFFEFIGRMADSKIISGRTAISFEFHNVEGRQLMWPRDASQLDDFLDRHSAWCQDDSFTVENPYTSADLIDRRRELALEASLQIYSRFGWSNPPIDELEKMQQEKFGPPIHL